MTFSLAARCPHSGMFGIGITTSDICVGSRCPFVRAGVGAVLSQHCTDPRLGPVILARLAEGANADAAIAHAVASTPHAPWRQLACVDAAGRTAVFHGSFINSIHAHATGHQVIALGNILANDGVPAAMIAAYEESTATFPSRLLKALEGGLAAGGEEFALRSAALLVCDQEVFPAVDLRVDYDAAPLKALRSLWIAYEPVASLFRQRALDPDNVSDS